MVVKAGDPPCLGWYSKTESECRKCICATRCSSYTKTKNSLERLAKATNVSNDVEKTDNQVSAKPPVVKREKQPSDILLEGFRKKYGVPSKDETEKAIVYKYKVEGKDVLWVAFSKVIKDMVRIVNESGKRDVKINTIEEAENVVNEIC